MDRAYSSRQVFILHNRVAHRQPPITSISIYRWQLLKTPATIVQLTSPTHVPSFRLVITTRLQLCLRLEASKGACK